MALANINPTYYGGWCVGDFILEMQLDFFLGNAVKYLARHKGKNGLEDLRKMVTYLDRVTHFPKDWKDFDATAEVKLERVTDFAESLGFGELEFLLLTHICQYAVTGVQSELQQALSLAKQLINNYISAN